MNEFCRVYGEALFELATERKEEKSLLNQLKAISTILEENEEYQQLMGNYSIPLQERIRMIDNAFAGHISDSLLNFLKILCERGAFRQYSGCVHAFENLYNAANNIEPVIMTSAIELNDDQKERIVSVLSNKTGKTIQLTVKVDPNVRGGLRCEMSGRRFDNTIETRMDILRRVLSERS